MQITMDNVPSGVTLEDRLLRLEAWHYAEIRRAMCLKHNWSSGQWLGRIRGTISLYATEAVDLAALVGAPVSEIITGGDLRQYADKMVSELTAATV